ncbi:MAG: hypothetical protein N4Q32_00240, partial [Neisseriaceae bacterium]|nr:hypothetical protein [Neisseriaceae bacterium]
QLFDAWQNLLKPNGMLFFSFLGLDSFQEIYQLFNQPLKNNIPSYHMDMHDVGDDLISTGFIEPVISMDKMTMSYKKRASLINDLTHLGVLPMMLSWLNISYQEFDNTLQKIEQTEKNFNVSYEFIFAHAIYQDRNHSPSAKEQEIKFYQK